MENIYIIGFMGAGKSVISENLKKRLGFTLIDTDVFIESNENDTIKNIFANKGEEYFRDLETDALRELAKENKLIVSCGGGAILREENVRIMKDSGTVVLLEASPEVIYARINGRHNRPLSDGKSFEEINSMMKKRQPFYEKAADLTIRSDEYSPYATAAKIQRKLGLGNTPL